MQHRGNGEMAQLVKCDLQTRENQEWQRIPIIPALEKWRQEDSSSLWPDSWVKSVRKREGEREIEKNIQCRPLDFCLYTLSYLHTCVTYVHMHTQTLTHHHLSEYPWQQIIHFDDQVRKDFGYSYMDPWKNGVQSLPVKNCSRSLMVLRGTDNSDTSILTKHRNKSGKIGQMLPSSPFFGLRLTRIDSSKNNYNLQSSLTLGIYSLLFKFTWKYALRWIILRKNDFNTFSWYSNYYCCVEAEHNL